MEALDGSTDTNEAMMEACILVVEDETDLRRSVCDILQLEGYEILEASNGLEALRRLEEAPNRPDLILLDLLMPEMDGWTFRRRQRNEERFESIPVVIFTGVTLTDEDRETLDPVAFLEKPVLMEELLDIVSGQFET
jgi:CheY-like chemotaxis protein